MGSIAIAVCTYNPVDGILKEVLDGISELILPAELEVEGIIVDNNSQESLADRGYVQKFLKENDHFKLRTEKKAGLSFARFCALENANSKWLLFCDDDNLLDKNYLINSLELISSFEQVGVWGPGVIDVKYKGRASRWLKSNRDHFQQRNFIGIQLHNKPATFKGYPPGTGLLIKREAMSEYHKMYLSGALSVTDRTGKSLSSGGDVHMVWTAIKMGYYVGLSDSLRLQHLIDESKSNFNYVKKLTFGRTTSWPRVKKEFYPEQYRHTEWNAKVLLVKLGLSFWHNFFNGRRNIQLSWIKVLAIYYGHMAINEGRPNVIARIIKKFLNV